MYQIILCEDDRRIVRQMNNFFQMNSVKVQFEAVATGEELLEKIKNGANYDIYIVGNMLRPFNGIAIVKALRERGIKNEIMLLSGVEGYYEDAFELEIFRYIKKPINWIHYRKCIQKAVEKINSNNRYFYYRKDSNICKILISDILYFESSRRVVNIVTKSGIVTYYDRLDMVETNIRQKNCYFIRIHKSYLVNIEQVAQYDYSKLYLYNEQSLPISENKRGEIKDEYMSYIDGMVCGICY